ncbi:MULTISPECIES: cytochrome b [unclassified Lysobacter]|uniref:cytochrome b n=1 Tax=unclassified Lysobacter TaxID=2635362 RepID=UPI001BEAC0B4|nr:MULTISPECIES: cytochrome b [unclassified Lysobacter]MBT2745112.1 cytochrome b [Lysobacter sp. ISL-42]MBT2750961.1 cytochrome b [Lysobacter sp. ISL-50]MBT2778028.1 cytochrome b [Lysobacter sp. ISL-54]MBT2783914.1 cytochrome b [Lysobacter sp. ISL-52]
MTLKNTADRWGAVSQLLHWLIMLLIAAIAVIGLTMVDMSNGLPKIKTYALHKSLGLTLLTLVVLRLLWRMYAGAPKPVDGTPHWQERIASLTHWVLYALMFALPISGWVFNSSSGYPLQYFGLFNLPKIAQRSEDLAQLSRNVHEYGFWLLLALVLAHAAAAFYHHLFQNDATLTRMLPGGRRSFQAVRDVVLDTVPPASPSPEKPDAN